MTEQRPEWLANLHKAIGEAGQQLQQALGQAARTAKAQEAMGWAFRGEVERTTTTLADLSDDHLREIAAAAEMLSTAADSVLTSRRD
ncbi:hypothetical protein ACQEVF_56955 [Nonomuraea polychroma]|uniref:hypothetical protein n=1 Tax=Nonomuraea polychroma TaxID=46176 RepID=UPI003D8FF12F